MVYTIVTWQFRFFLSRAFLSLSLQNGNLRQQNDFPFSLMLQQALVANKLMA